MKKYFPLIIISIFIRISISNAQITINSSDIASSGNVIYQAYDTLPIISVGISGVNQMWNFAGLLNTHLIDTLTFQTVSTSENYYDFPSTNVVIPINKIGDLRYAQNTPTELTVLGTTEQRILYIGGDMTTIIKPNTPSEKLMVFPSTYNTTFTSYHNSFTQYYYGSVPRACGVLDSIRETTTIDKIVLADAWGSLTTDAGTFDVLRFKETRITTDAIDGRDALLTAWFNLSLTTDTTIIYTWYANGIGAPLVTATMDSTGNNVGHVQWLTAPPTAVGMNEYNSAQVSLYPNPAQNQIHVNTGSEKITSIQVFDASGKLIKTYPIYSVKTSVDIYDLANGIYSYVLLGKDQSILNRGKFSVSK